MAQRLAGKVAIVTGGARGIGRAMTAALVAEGARAVIADIDVAAAQQTAEELKGDRPREGAGDGGKRPVRPGGDPAAPGGRA